MKKRLHIQVFGVVQMVGFRYFTDDIAHLLGITGSAENIGNSEVEIFAEGQDYMLPIFIHAVKLGPLSARVDSAVIEDQEVKGDKTFEIIRPKVETALDTHVTYVCEWCGEDQALHPLHLVQDADDGTPWLICDWCYSTAGLV